MSDSPRVNKIATGLAAGTSAAFGVLAISKFASGSPIAGICGSLVSAWAGLDAVQLSQSQPSVMFKLPR